MTNIDRRCKKYNLLYIDGNKTEEREFRFDNFYNLVLKWFFGH